MKRNKGNDMATYSKQDWTHDKNQPIRTWNNEQEYQSERDAKNKGTNSTKTWG